MASYVSTFTGDGSDVTFTAGFPVLRLTDLAVVVGTTWLTLGTEYSVSGPTSAPIATLAVAPGIGVTVTLRSAVGYTPTDPAAVTTAAPNLNDTDTALWEAIGTGGSSLLAETSARVGGDSAALAVIAQDIADVRADYGGTPGTILDAWTVLATDTAASRSLADRFADVVNVLDFGAVGDAVPLSSGSTTINGTVNDAAFAAAIAYACAAGKAIYVPVGNYRLTAAFTATITALGSSFKGLRMYGEGQHPLDRRSNLYVKEVTGHMLAPVQAWWGTFGGPVVLDGLNFDGSNGYNDHNTASTTWAGLIDGSGATSLPYFRIKNCTIQQTKVAGATLLDCTNLWDVCVDDCQVLGAWAANTLLFKTSGVTTTVRISRTYFHYASQGFEASYGSAVPVFRDCIFEAMMTVGAVEGATARLDNCHLEAIGYGESTWGLEGQTRQDTQNAPAGDRIDSWFNICRGSLILNETLMAAPGDGAEGAICSGVFRFVTATDPAVSAYIGASLKMTDCPMLFTYADYEDRFFLSDAWDVWQRPYIEINQNVGSSTPFDHSSQLTRSIHLMAKAVIRSPFPSGGNARLEADYGRAIINAEAANSSAYPTPLPYLMPAQVGDIGRRQSRWTNPGDVTEWWISKAKNSTLATQINWNTTGSTTFTLATGDGAGVAVNDICQIHVSPYNTVAVLVTNVSGDDITVTLVGTRQADAVVGTPVSFYLWTPNPLSQMGYRTGAATPVASVTPYFAGERYLDTTAKNWWTATGPNNTDWE